MKGLFLLLIPIFLISCDLDEDKAIYDDSLNGEWMLTEISCFCAFDPETDYTQTRLLFDVENSKVTVTNHGEYELFKPSGVYYYGGQNNIINFPDETGYQFEVKGKQLSLVYLDHPDIADDEVAYYFLRP